MTEITATKTTKKEIGKEIHEGRERRLASLSLWSLVLAAFIILFSATACGPAGENEPLKIGYQTGWVPKVNVGLVLEKTDLLEQHGLEGRLEQFVAGPPQMEGFLAGEIEIAFTGDGPAISLLSRDTDATIVSRSVEYLGRIIVPADSDVESVSDLEGKTIGAMFGTGVYRQLLTWLDEAGLDHEADVDIVDLAPPEWLSALYGGHVDAIAGWAPATQQGPVKGRAKVIKEGVSRGVMVIDNDLIENRRDDVIAFLRAYREAFHYAVENEDEVNQWVVDLTQIPLDVVEASNLEDLNWRRSVDSPGQVMVELSEQELEELQAFADFLYERDQIRQPVDIRANYDNSLIREARGE